MRLSATVVPQISRDVVRRLLVDGDIVIGPTRVANVEEGLSAIMREYLIREEQLNRATREALERRGLDQGRFEGVKRELADVRGFRTGDEGIESVVGQMIQLLLASRQVEEVFAADGLLRRKIRAAMKCHLEAEERLPPAPAGGGTAPPPSSGGEPSGGTPAEARVSDVPPPVPPEKDPDQVE